MLHALGRILIAGSILIGLPLFAAASSDDLINGQVQKIDVAAGKITLKHGPIKNLDMDSMTMVFRIKDTVDLTNLKVGDKVRFAADRVDGAITVVKIDKVQ